MEKGAPFIQVVGLVVEPSTLGANHSTLMDSFGQDKGGQKVVQSCQVLNLNAKSNWCFFPQPSTFA